MAYDEKYLFSKLQRNLSTFQRHFL